MHCIQENIFLLKFTLFILWLSEQKLVSRFVLASDGPTPGRCTLMAATSLRSLALFLIKLSTYQSSNTNLQLFKPWAVKSSEIASCRTPRLLIPCTTDFTNLWPDVVKVKKSAKKC